MPRALVLLQRSRQVSTCQSSLGTSAVPTARRRLACLPAQPWPCPSAGAQLTLLLKGTTGYPEEEEDTAFLSLQLRLSSSSPGVNKKQMFPSDLLPSNGSKAFAGNLWLYKLLSTLKLRRPCNVFVHPLAPVDIGVCFQHESKGCR